MRLEFETPVTFQGKSVPTGTQLAGWAALVRALSLQVSVRQPGCVSQKHVRGSHREEGGWRIFDKRYQPGDRFEDHLAFALRHEAIDLLTLRSVPLKRCLRPLWKSTSGPRQAARRPAVPGFL